MTAVQRSRLSITILVSGMAFVAVVLIAVTCSPLTGI